MLSKKKKPSARNSYDRGCHQEVFGEMNGETISKLKCGLIGVTAGPTFCKNTLTSQYYFLENGCHKGRYSIHTMNAHGHKFRLVVLQR